MKKLIWLVLILCGSWQFAIAQTGNGYSGHHWTISQLDFATSAPPFLMTVVDSQGRRTGGDPSQSVGIHGQQGPHSNSGFNEIPFSGVDQDNIADDETGEDQLTTLWQVEILDGGRQTYTVNLFGITTGEGLIHVSGSGGTMKTHSVRNRFNVFVAQGQTRQVNVTFDPSALTLLVQRVVGSSDLLNDVKVACQLNLITSRVCKRLTKKAEAIQAALEKKNFEKAEELIKSFLHSLGELRGDGDKDEDDHDAIKEPALTILIEDAKALLAQIEKDEKLHEHEGDDHHDRDAKDDRNNEK